MTPERWERVKHIVADALDLQPPARGPFVEQACAADPDLRRQVDTLLAADDPDSRFLSLERAPDRIGPYRVVREIGRGGMGTVYLGERADGQFEQRAAIKVIKRGMDSDAVLRRFYAERQFLARLQHPNITRLLDGGMFEGRPYFVMEYLEGATIFEHCGKANLATNARIHLFLTVCAAVEYAHQNLILHRDLKAGNILIQPDGTPKLLDFGIAKLLEDDGAAEQTALALRALTPQSASPEQVRGEPLTTASDVYSLGVLLYELLSGRAPYKVEARSQVEMLRTICDQPPPRAPELRGDLENIVLKAMEKDPAQRYQRAADLAEDLRRYLDARPVQARPAGAAYRAGKFIRRHRKALAVAALVVLAIGGALADAIRQERRANRRFDELRQLAGTFLFEFHDAIKNLPGSTPARELVEKRALQYLDSLASEAKGDIGLKRELAEGYVRIGDAQGLYFESNLGKPAETRAAYEKAVALLEAVMKAQPSDVKPRNELAQALLRLATTYQSTDAAKGETQLRRAIGLLEESARGGRLDAQAQLNLGRAYFGIAEHELELNRVDEALGARMQSIGILEALVAKDANNAEAQRSLAQSEKRLAYLYLVKRHDAAKAAIPLRHAMSIDEMLVARNPSSATAKLDLALGEDYLGTVLRRQGDTAQGRRLVESAIAIRNEVWQADPKNFRVRSLLISNYAKLMQWLRQDGQPAEAEAARKKGLLVAEGMQSPPGEDSLSAAMAALRGH